MTAYRSTIRRPRAAVSTLMVVVPVLLVSGAARAALTLTYVRAQSGAQSENRLLLDEHHFRMDGQPRPAEATRAAGAAAGQLPRTHSVIMDATLHKVIVLDPDKRTYFEVTQDDMVQMKAQMDAMRGQMQERMKNLPPEQKKRMEQMLGPNARGAGETPLVRYEPLGKKRTVAGYACETYKVIVADQLTSETCFSPWGGPIANQADADKFKKLTQELKQMFEWPGMGRAQDWGKVPGVPVEEKRFDTDGKTVSWTNTLKSVSRAAMAPGTFAAPADYKQEPNPLRAGLARHPLSKP